MGGMGMSKRATSGVHPPFRHVTQACGALQEKGAAAGFFEGLAGAFPPCPAAAGKVHALSASLSGLGTYDASYAARTWLLASLVAYSEVYLCVFANSKRGKHRIMVWSGGGDGGTWGGKSDTEGLRESEREKESPDGGRGIKEIPPADQWMGLTGRGKRMSAHCLSINASIDRRRFRVQHA